MQKLASLVSERDPQLLNARIKPCHRVFASWQEKRLEPIARGAFSDARRPPRSQQRDQPPLAVYRQDFEVYSEHALARLYLGGKSISKGLLVPPSCLSTENGARHGPTLRQKTE